MHQAGIGGYEINPMSLPVKVDLIVGSGWPFGAEFLKPGEMTKRFYLNSIPVQGPVTFIKSIEELSVPLEIHRSYKGALKPECQFIHMAPAGISEISQSIDITGQIKDGILTAKVPAGKHIVHVGLIQEGFSEVYQGSPGAMGPVLDHYKADALERFLNKMSDKLGPALGGRLGPAVRAVFCDSIELSAANWTTDIRAVFEKQHGYDLLPYLPYIVDTRTPITGEDPWNDRLKRVRYAYSKTLVELFHERFIKVYHKWYNDNGCLSRYQAYGTPWLMGMLDGYLIPDIPETNYWLFVDTDQKGHLVWNKYCSSAGHIKGRRIISSETMSQVAGVFQATLDQIKADDDMNFIMGINHSVLHGFTYSPPEEGPYARVRYGSYFSDQNTWWPYLRKLTDYNARLSAVFQNSKPVVSIAILGPRADLWSKVGLEREPFHNTPWYLPQLWKVFSQCGSSVDHASEPVLQNALPKAGKLQCDEMTYDVLIVAGAVSMEPKTTEMLLALAKDGVKIVFIDNTPSRGPSLNDLGAGDRDVKENIQSVLKQSSNVFQVGAPDSEKPWENSLLSWADKLPNTIETTRDIMLDTLDSSFYQIRMRDGDRDIFFLVNTDSDKMLEFDAEFNSKRKTAWHWNPETAKRSLYASPVSGPISITLPPHGSLLLVFEPGNRGKAAPRKKELDPGIALSGTWDCQFIPA